MPGLSYVLHGRTVVVEPDPAAWSAWIASAIDEGRHVVAQSLLTPNRSVSTAFVGIDYAEVPGRDAPVVFETQVFENGEIADQRRYSSWDEAHLGHADLVAAQALISVRPR